MVGPLGKLYSFLISKKGWWYDIDWGLWVSDDEGAWGCWVYVRTQYQNPLVSPAVFLPLLPSFKTTFFQSTNLYQFASLSSDLVVQGLEPAGGGAMSPRVTSSVLASKTCARSVLPFRVGGLMHHGGFLSLNFPWKRKGWIEVLSKI